MFIIEYLLARSWWMIWIGHPHPLWLGTLVVVVFPVPELEAGPHDLASLSSSAISFCSFHRIGAVLCARLILRASV